MQRRFVERGDRQRPAAEQRPQRPQPAFPAGHRHRRDARRVIAQPGQVGKVGGAVGKAEDVHLVRLPQVADFVKRHDLVAAVGRVGNALADEKYAHRSCLRGRSRARTPLRGAVSDTRFVVEGKAPKRHGIRLVENAPTLLLPHGAMGSAEAIGLTRQLQAVPPPRAGCRDAGLRRRAARHLRGLRRSLRRRRARFRQAPLRPRQPIPLSRRRRVGGVRASRLPAGRPSRCAARSPRRKPGRRSATTMATRSR